MPYKSHLQTLLGRLERLLKADIRYLLRGNFWLVASRLISTGSGFVLSIAFANLLSPDTYGVYKYVIAVVGITGAFSLTGLVTALTNSIARGDLGVLRTTFWTSMRWSLLASTLTLAVGGYYWLHHNVTLALCLLIAALCLPLLITGGNYRAIFFGLPDFKAGALWGIPRSFFPSAVLLVVVFFTQNPVLLIAAYFISNMLTVIWLYARAVKTYKVPKTAKSTEPTVRFAKYNSVLSIFFQIGSQFDQFLMWHFVGAAGVAYYSFATSLIEQLLTFTGNIFTLVTPKFAKKGTDAEVHATLPLRMLQMFVVLVPITAAYIIAAPYIFHYLFPKYVGVVIYSQIYALILLVQPIGLIDAALIAREDVSARNFLVGAGQFIKLVALFVGISHAGLMGGVIALLVSEVINMFLGLALVWHIKRKPAV